MIEVGRIAIGPDMIMVATALDLSLQSVMARGAKGLPVGSIKEEIEVTFVFDHVVHHGGFSYLATILMEATDRVLV